jgi:hypothetical protein
MPIASGYGQLQTLLTTAMKIHPRQGSSLEGAHAFVLIHPGFSSWRKIQTERRDFRGDCFRDFLLRCSAILTCERFAEFRPRIHADHNTPTLCKLGDIAVQLFDPGYSMHNPFRHVLQNDDIRSMQRQYRINARPTARIFI